MKRSLLPFAILTLVVMQTNALSQSDAVPKYEIAAEFSTLERDAFGGERLEAGFGGRFTFNLNNSFALEAAGYFFPRRCFDCLENGRMTQAVGGAKIGKRFETWGIFAKARPGVVSYSEGEFNILLSGPGQQGGLTFQNSRVTGFAADFGGVLEFYPSRRIVTRFDAGDTIVHFRQRVESRAAFDPSTNMFNIFPVPRPARTTHNFQFTASVGFRF